MSSYLIVIVTTLAVVSQTAVAQTAAHPTQGTKVTRPVIENPTYSEAILQGRDPHEFLAEAENELRRAATPRLGLWALDRAAKRALEAGELQKAYDYATRALAIAEEWDTETRIYATGNALSSLRMSRTGQTTFYANFVLGRLAILKGDVRVAEQYLLASGNTPGSVTLCSYGPNMSLAQELLKHGDDQTRQVILQFFEQISKFWINIVHSPVPQWTADVIAGKIPNFESVGVNLIY